MKHLIIIISILALSSACKVTGNNKTGTITTPDQPTIGATNIVSGVAEVIGVTPSKADTAYLRMSYMYYKFDDAGHLLYQDSVNYKIAEFVVRSTEFELDSLGEPNLNADFFQKQLMYFDSLSQLEAQLSETDQLWDLEGSIEIKEYDNFVELNLSAWSYTGGAHGNGFSSYELIDYDLGGVLHLEDFIQDVPTFTLLAEKYFRAANDIAEGADLGELGFWFADNTFSCNENFYFDSNGMHFLYNSYEIAPYSAGPISFNIPLYELKPFLKIQP